jgi:hypothetical protein
MIYFRSQPALRPPPNGGDVRLLVRRDSLFDTAFVEVMSKSPEDLKKRLMVSFRGEEGVDFGGVSREFFFLLSHAIFDPSYALFEPVRLRSFFPSLSLSSSFPSPFFLPLRLVPPLLYFIRTATDPLPSLLLRQ